MNTLQYINYNENNKQNIRLNNIESKKDMLIETYKEDFETNEYIDLDNSNIIINKHGITTKNNKTKIIDFLNDEITDYKNSVNVRNDNGTIMLNPNQYWGTYVTNTIKTDGTKYIELNAEDKVFSENTFNLKKEINSKEYDMCLSVIDEYIYIASIKGNNLNIQKIDKDQNVIIEKKMTLELYSNILNPKIFQNENYIILYIDANHPGYDHCNYCLLLLDKGNLDVLANKKNSAGDCGGSATPHYMYMDSYNNMIFMAHSYRGYMNPILKETSIFSIEKNTKNEYEFKKIKDYDISFSDVLQTKILNDDYSMGVLYKDSFKIYRIDDVILNIDISNPLYIYNINNIIYILTYDDNKIIVNQLNISDNKIEIVNRIAYDSPNIQNKDSFNLKLLNDTVYIVYTVPQILQDKERTCMLIIDTTANNSFFKINYKEYINGNIDISKISNKLFLSSYRKNIVKIYESENNRNNIKYFISNDDGYNYHEIQPGKKFEFPKIDDDIKIKIELNNFETVSPFISKVIITQWNDEKETKELSGTFLSKILPFYSRNKIGVLTADLISNGANIKWFISDNGGIDFEEIHLGIPFNLNQEFSTELKIKIELTNDLTKNEIPIIKSYTLKTTSFVLQPQIEVMQINLMKTNFKIDTLTNAASNSLKNMFIDVFSNENNINKEMSNCVFDPINKNYSGDFVISNPIIIGRMKSRIMLTTEEILNKGSIEYYISGDNKNWYSIQKEIPKSLNNILRKNFIMIKAILKNGAKISAWGISWD